MVIWKLVRKLFLPMKIHISTSFQIFNLKVIKKIPAVGERSVFQEVFKFTIIHTAKHLICKPKKTLQQEKEVQAGLVNELF